MQLAVAAHLQSEKASFHTPGHKGRQQLSKASSSCQPSEGFALACDVTELVGLDDLSAPHGVLAQLERRIANLWGARSSLISVGGASSGLLTALLVLAQRGKRVLVPRNAHRSIIHGLILSGLEPVWFAPNWHRSWGVWGEVDSEQFAQIDLSNLAGAIVVSPTYAGAISPIASIASICHAAGVPLVVDEAHGAHMLAESSAAIADITVHSLHKTLPCLTQTALIHINSDFFALDAARRALALNQTSSPNYGLLLSVDLAVSWLENCAAQGKRPVLQQLELLRDKLVRGLKQLNFDIYQSTAVDCAHCLVRPLSASANELAEFLCQEGVIPEAILGEGVLLLLGTGTEALDIDLLLDVLQRFNQYFELPASKVASKSPSKMPLQPEQVVNPREAFFMPSEMVPITQAIGRIAQECIAPCPPGVPVCIPGQRIHPEVVDLANRNYISVLKE